VTEAQRAELAGGWALVALAVALAMLVRALSIQTDLERERRRELRDSEAAMDELRARVKELEGQRGGRVDHEALKRDRPDADPEADG
jgi:hypothetical protein